MLPEDNIRPHLKVLDLEPGVSMDEVKRAYRVMVKVWHPDRFMDDPALRNVAQEKLKSINASYDWLLQHWDEVDNSSLNRDTTASSASENPAGTEDHRWRRSGTRRVNAQTVWTVIVIGLFVIVAQAAWRNADRISFRSSIPSAAPVETRPELSGNDKEVAPNLSTQPSSHNDGRLSHS